eukprot:Opistho-2@83841
MDADAIVSDVSLLLGLSEEVLIHVVKIGRFTLTDIGHLRATCKPLRNFFDRIRETVHDYVVGDLSTYRPYAYWNIDLAAASGHLEVIELLHEDEVKRGRVTNCSNAAAMSAVQRHRFHIFQFLVRNRREVYAPKDIRPWFLDTFNDVVNPLQEPWRQLSSEQALFLVHEAPSFLAANGGENAINGIWELGDVETAVKMLPFVSDRAVLFSVGMAVEKGDAAVVEAIYRECTARGIDSHKVAEHLFCGAARSGRIEAIDVAVRLSPVKLSELADKALEEVEYLFTDQAFMARFVERGLRRIFVNPRVDNVADMHELKVTWLTLLECFRCGNYEAAEVVEPRLTVEDLNSVLGSLLDDGNSFAAVQWLHKRRPVSEMAADELVRYYPESKHAMGETRRKLTVDYVDCVWPIAKTLPVYEGNIFSLLSGAWFRKAIELGDMPLLRHLCKKFDFVSIFNYNSAHRSECDAAAAGHYDVISFMIGVNSKAILVRTKRMPDVAFDVQSRPFRLKGILDAAVRAGHVRLALMIDRRVPGLPVSLSSAVVSRRWVLFRHVLKRQPSPEDMNKALFAAVEANDLAFVRWFEEHTPDVFQRCLPRFGEYLRNARDMKFLGALLQKHPEITVSLRFGEYDTFALEHKLGVRIVRRPLGMMSALSSKAGRSTLQAVIDFRIPVKQPSSSWLMAMEDGNVTLYKWVKENVDGGSFVFE